jgi:DHA2 family multidrug resistance protein-like MFS transporter
MLIATRAALGVAAATLAPSTLSLIRNMFLDPDQRRTAIAVWITSFSVGAAIGPLLGGLVLEFFWWGAAFLVAVPVMALLLVLGPRLLPEFRDPEAGRPDIPSAALSLAAVLAAIFGLKQIAQDGWGWLPALSILAGVALGVLFVRRQRHLVDPFIDLQLFRMPGFSASLATYGVGILLVFGGFLFLPQYLQLVLGLSPLEAGFWTLPWALAFVVGSMLTPRIVRRVHPAFMMAAGLVLAAFGFGVFTQVDAASGFAAIVTGSVVFSLGTAPLFTLTNDLIIGSAPPERAGAAAGLSETSAELGGALGIAFFGSIGTAIYRGAMAGGIPEGIPQSAAETARDTLGGAVEVAGQLPRPAGASLIDAAREAFIQGLNLTAAISGVGAIALAVFIAVLLRRMRVGSGPEGDADLEQEPAIV